MESAVKEKKIQSVIKKNGSFSLALEETEKLSKREKVTLLSLHLLTVLYAVNVSV